jgi:hypothetical protein
METVKLEQSEIDKLSALQEKQQQYIGALGRIEYDMTLLDNQKQRVQALIQELLTEQDNVGRELEEKYGTGTVDLEKGELYKQ